jgi:lambda family phage portal protein
MSTSSNGNNKATMPRLRRTSKPAATLEQQAAAEEAALRLDRAKLARQTLAVGRSMLGDYDTRRTRLGPSTRPPKGSGDSQLDLGTLDQIRGQAQRMQRRNPLGGAIVTRLADLIVGRGLHAEAKSGDAEFDTAADAYFDTWSKQHADVTGKLTFGQMQHAMLRALLVDGDVGVHLVRGAGQDADLLDLVALQLVESDLIAKDPAKGDTTDGTIINGVELDGVGRPIRFHITSYRRGGTGLEPTSSAVDAENFLLWAHRTRISQTRGESPLVRMLWVLDQIHEYIRSTVVSARVAACQSLVIKTEFPLDSAAGGLGGLVPTTNQVTGGSTTERQEEMEAGSVWRLAPGESVETVRPEQPTQNFEDVIRTMVRMAANDVGLPLELALLDFSQTNFHSARSSIGVAYKSIERWQRQMCDSVLSRVYRFVIGNAIAAGVLPEVENWDRHAWKMPARPSLDPQRETMAAVLAVNNNMRTLADVHAEMGLDHDDVLLQRSIEVADQAKYGITPAGGQPVDGAVGGAGADQSGTAVDRAEADLED